MARVAALKTRSLTARQEAFVREYLVDRNATQAAIRAGYSARNADHVGPLLVRKSCVRDRIEKAEKEHFQTLGISAELFLSHVWRGATYDARSFYKMVDGKLVAKDLDELTPEQGMLIQDIRTDADGKIVGYKLVDHQKSQDLFGKCFGLDKINIEARVSADVEQAINIDLSGANPRELAWLVRESAGAVR